MTETYFRPCWCSQVDTNHAG